MLDEQRGQNHSWGIESALNDISVPWRCLRVSERQGEGQRVRARRVGRGDARLDGVGSVADVASDVDGVVATDYIEVSISKEQGK